MFMTELGSKSLIFVLWKRGYLSTLPGQEQVPAWWYQEPRPTCLGDLLLARETTTTPVTLTVKAGIVRTGWFIFLIRVWWSSLRLPTGTLTTLIRLFTHLITPPVSWPSNLLSFFPPSLLLNKQYFFPLIPHLLHPYPSLVFVIPLPRLYQPYRIQQILLHGCC